MTPIYVKTPEAGLETWYRAVAELMRWIATEVVEPPFSKARNIQPPEDSGIDNMEIRIGDLSEAATNLKLSPLYLMPTRHSWRLLHSQTKTKSQWRDFDGHSSIMNYVVSSFIRRLIEEVVTNQLSGTCNKIYFSRTSQKWNVSRANLPIAMKIISGSHLQSANEAQVCHAWPDIRWIHIALLRWDSTSHLRSPRKVAEVHRYGILQCLVTVMKNGDLIRILASRYTDD